MTTKRTDSLQDDETSSSGLPPVEDRKQWALDKLKGMSLEEKIRLLDSLIIKVEKDEKQENFDHKVAFYTLKSAVGLCYDVIDALANELEKERKLVDQMALSTVLKKALNPV